MKLKTKQIWKWFFTYNTLSSLFIVTSYSYSNIIQKSRYIHTTIPSMSKNIILKENVFPCVLFIVTNTDNASLNIANSLQQNFKWKSILYEIDMKFYSSTLNIHESVSINNDYLVMWTVNIPLLDLNYPNEIFKQVCSKYEPMEIIFLSRHSAASGLVSLTVHPIGIPWMMDTSRSGGIAGKCSPPNLRIASLYRDILRETKINEMEKEFLITLEATHHGPYSELPACFVEIGSSEVDWNNPIAGDLWAKCLAKHFGMRGSNTTELGKEDITSVEQDFSKNDCIVLITIGGGHYVPKMNDLVSYGS